MFIIRCTGDLGITINDESGGKITEQVLSHARDRPRDLKSRSPPLGASLSLFRAFLFLDPAFLYPADRMRHNRHNPVRHILIVGPTLLRPWSRSSCQLALVNKICLLNY
jgi:hypothetical protein